MQIHLMSIRAVSTAACLLMLPMAAFPQELSIEEILQRLYGDNVERVSNADDQLWINDGGAARARAKFTANPDGRFGFATKEVADRVALFTFTGSNLGFNVAGSGELPDPGVVAQFRWTLSDLAIGGGPWSSRPSDNRDGVDHVITYRITGGESAGNFVLFWEDLPGTQRDDFNDFVVEVSGVSLATSPSPRYSFTLKPGPLAFGNQEVWTSTVLNYWLRNNGDIPLPIESVRLRGMDATAFSVDDRCGVNVPPRVRCSLMVTFRPSAPGTQAAKLQVVAGDGDLRTRELTGAGVQSSFWVGPQTSLSFGTVTVNTTSAAKLVRVSNLAGAPTLELESIQVGGRDAAQFPIRHDCPKVLPANTHCSIFVTFAPRSRASASAMLAINPAVGPARSVPLAGAGR